MAEKTLLSDNSYLNKLWYKNRNNVRNRGYLRSQDPICIKTNHITYTFEAKGISKIALIIICRKIITC